MCMAYSCTIQVSAHDHSTTLPTLVCHCRDASLDYAKQLFPTDTITHGNVFDAMQMGPLCNRTRPSVDPNAQRTHVRGGIPRTRLMSESESRPASLFVVDPTSGSDDGRGDGSVHRPFRSVHRAVEAARERRAGTAGQSYSTTVVLRQGTHYLGRTLHLDERDSGLTITSVEGEEAIVSGGTPISGLVWRKAEAPLPDGVYVTDVPSNPNTSSFDALFVGDRLEIRAR